MFKHLKTKATVNIIGLILAFFCYTESLAGVHTIATPYFKISLDQSMKQFESSSQKMKETSAYRYGYSAKYQGIEASLGIVVVPSLPGNEMDNPDRAQKQFIAGTVHGLFRQNNLPEPDIYAIYNTVKSIRANNIEFKTFTVVDENDHIMIIYTTTKNNKLYGFYITVISDTTTNSKKIKAISKSLINSVIHAQLLSSD